MELSEYLIYAVILSAVTGIIGAVSHTALENECASAIGVIVLALLAAPIVGGLSSGDLGGFPEYVEVGATGGYAEVGEEAFISGVEGYLCAEYSLAPEEVELALSGYSFSEARAAEMTVRLSGMSVFADARGMKAEIEELFLLDNGVCRVVMDIG